MLCKEKSNFFTKLSSYVKKNKKNLHSDYGILEIPDSAGELVEKKYEIGATKYEIKFNIECRTLSVEG